MEHQPPCEEWKEKTEGNHNQLGLYGYALLWPEFFACILWHLTLSFIFKKYFIYF